MTDSNNLLSKVITSGQMGGKTAGGILNPTQSDRFIDYFFDQVVLMPQVRQVRMNSDVMDIDKIGIGRRILRGATEAVDDGINVGVRFTKISLTTTKLRADLEFSTDVLEDNVEGADLEDHIARLAAGQIGQDLEDLAINGDKGSPDPLLHHLDGWGVRAEADGITVDWDAAAHAEAPGNGAGNEVDGMTRKFLGAMLKAFPRKYKSRQDLRFFAGSDLVQDYVAFIGEAAANATNFDPRAELNVDTRPGSAAGYTVNGISGVRMQEVPLMENREVTDLGDDDAPGGEGANADTTSAVADVWLTFPQNLVWGTRREIQVYTEFKPKTDSTEYTIYTRVAAGLEENDAFVVGKDVPVQ